MNRLYFDSAESLADAAAGTDIADARALLATYMAHESAAKVVECACKTEAEARQRARRRLSDLRAETSAEREGREKAVYTATLNECKSAGDAGRHAEKHAAQLNIEKHLTRTLCYADGQLIPEALLALHIAEADLFRETGNRLMAEALIAAIERHQAAMQLVAVDGTAVLSASSSGRAHSMWLAAVESHRRAAEAERAVDAEKERMARLEAVK